MSSYYDDEELPNSSKTKRHQPRDGTNSDKYHMQHDRKRHVNCDENCNRGHCRMGNIHNNGYDSDLQNDENYFRVRPSSEDRIRSGVDHRHTSRVGSSFTQLSICASSKYNMNDFCNWIESFVAQNANEADIKKHYQCMQYIKNLCKRHQLHPSTQNENYEENSTLSKYQIPDNDMESQYSDDDSNKLAAVKSSGIQHDNRYLDEDYSADVNVPNESDPSDTCRTNSRLKYCCTNSSCPYRKYHERSDHAEFHPSPALVIVNSRESLPSNSNEKITSSLTLVNEKNTNDNYYGYYKRNGKPYNVEEEDSLQRKSSYEEIDNTSPRHYKICKFCRKCRTNLSNKNVKLHIDCDCVNGIENFNQCSTCESYVPNNKLHQSSIYPIHCDRHSTNYGHDSTDFRYKKNIQHVEKDEYGQFRRNFNDRNTQQRERAENDLQKIENRSTLGQSFHIRSYSCRCVNAEANNKYHCRVSCSRHGIRNDGGNQYDNLSRYEEAPYDQAQNREPDSARHNEYSNNSFENGRDNRLNSNHSNRIKTREINRTPDIHDSVNTQYNYFNYHKAHRGHPLVVRESKSNINGAYEKPVVHNNQINTRKTTQSDRAGYTYKTDESRLQGRHNSKDEKYRNVTSGEREKLMQACCDCREHHTDSDGSHSVDQDHRYDLLEHNMLYREDHSNRQRPHSDRSNTHFFHKDDHLDNAEKHSGVNHYGSGHKHHSYGQLIDEDYHDPRIHNIHDNENTDGSTNDPTGSNVQYGNTTKKHLIDRKAITRKRNPHEQKHIVSNIDHDFKGDVIKRYDSGHHENNMDDYAKHSKRHHERSTYVGEHQNDDSIDSHNDRSWRKPQKQKSRYCHGGCHMICLSDENLKSIDMQRTTSDQRPDSLQTTTVRERMKSHVAPVNRLSGKQFSEYDSLETGNKSIIEQLDVPKHLKKKQDTLENDSDYEMDPRRGKGPLDELPLYSEKEVVTNFTYLGKPDVSRSTQVPLKSILKYPQTCCCIGNKNSKFYSEPLISDSDGDNDAMDKHNRNTFIKSERSFDRTVAESNETQTEKPSLKPYQREASDGSPRSAAHFKTSKGYNYPSKMAITQARQSIFTYNNLFNATRRSYPINERRLPEESVTQIL